MKITCGNQTFPNIQAILFDKDGTLVDSFGFLRELAQKRARLADAQIPGVGEPLLMAFGLQDRALDPAGLMAVGSRRDNEIATAAYIAETGRSWPESLAIAHRAFEEADRYLQRNTDTCPLFPGSAALLQRLSEAGLKVGVLSADSTANVEAFAQRYGLASCLQLLQGVEAGGPSKPDPALFQQACNRLGVAPSAALMVGDSQLDIAMAQQASAAGAIAIARPPAPPNGDADVTITDLSAIAIAA